MVCGVHSFIHLFVHWLIQSFIDSFIHWISLYFWMNVCQKEQIPVFYLRIYISCIFRRDIRICGQKWQNWAGSPTIMALNEHFFVFLAFRALFYTLFHSKWWQWNENWREIIRHIIPAIKKGFQSKEDNFSQFGTGVEHIYRNVQGCMMFQSTSTRGYDRCAHVPIFDF